MRALTNAVQASELVAWRAKVKAHHDSLLGGSSSSASSSTSRAGGAGGASGAGGAGDQAHGWSLDDPLSPELNKRKHIGGDGGGGGGGGSDRPIVVITISDMLELLKHPSMETRYIG